MTQPFLCSSQRVFLVCKCAVFFLFIYWQRSYSRCHCVVFCVFVHRSASFRAYPVDGFEGLSSNRIGSSDSVMVRGPSLLRSSGSCWPFSRLVSNRLLVAPPSHSSPADSSVEWAYAFDVHTNAFFPFFLTLYLAQLLILPVVLKDKWICLFLGNTLYLAGYVSSLLKCIEPKFTLS